jgi:hypothetical protein
VAEADPRHKVLLVFTMVYQAVVEIAELDAEPDPDPLPDPLPLEPLDEASGPTTNPFELIFDSHVWCVYAFVVRALAGPYFRAPSVHVAINLIFSTWSRLDHAPRFAPYRSPSDAVEFTGKRTARNRLVASVTVLQWVCHGPSILD